MKKQIILVEIAGGVPNEQQQRGGRGHGHHSNTAQGAAQVVLLHQLPLTR
jgi:hypothetical protein